jgi:farnesyl-diphosphate farnesyltransferase
MAAPDLLTSVLHDVSRSFYLTMRVLPGSIRRQIGLAYLLARTTDTIADTEIVPVERRLTALRALRDRILGLNRNPLDFSEFTKAQVGARQPFMAHCENALRDIEYDKLTDPTIVTHKGSEAERALLLRIEEILSVMSGFSAADQQTIRDVLSTITSGQELDLQRFGHASVQNITALNTLNELDDYTYRVAGCVGEFWTRMCRTHVFPNAALDETQFFADAVRFGKGLQLVNVPRRLELHVDRAEIMSARSPRLCLADLDRGAHPRAVAHAQRARRRATHQDQPSRGEANFYSLDPDLPFGKVVEAIISPRRATGRDVCMNSVLTR